ncbi:MAG: hypothetical protein WCD52_08480 [Xanthobacteraceae bacterium]
MSGQLLADRLRLPFLDPAPWRVAVISPTGRYARSQVASMREAGTLLVGGVALGRGGTAMDGLPLYDRIGDLPEQPNIALIYAPAEGVRDAIAECAASRIPTIMAAAEYAPVHDALAAAALARAAEAGSSAPTLLACSCRAGDCSAPLRRAFAGRAGSRSLCGAARWRSRWRGN